MKGKAASRASVNNRSNQLNPNNSVYWQSRGESSSREVAGTTTSPPSVTENTPPIVPTLAHDLSKI